MINILLKNAKFVDVDKVNPTSLTANQISTIFDFAQFEVDVTFIAGSAAPSAGEYNNL